MIMQLRYTLIVFFTDYVWRYFNAYTVFVFQL